MKNYSSPTGNKNMLFIWGPVLLGVLVLYFPTFANLSDTLWKQDNQSHGPIVLFAVLFLLWRGREYFFVEQNARPISGSLFLIFGLLVYLIGRSQDFSVFDVGSLIPITIGILLIFCGLKTLKMLWFPIFFMFFLIPLPASVLDVVTLPMKIAVSQVVEFILFNLGYPVARSGVILHVGQYQLLVADACAGMHTLISLEAAGLLYLNLVRHASVFRNVTLALLIVPVSFTANVVRVIIIVFVTYYVGDEAGQGFIHDFAGIVLLLVALLLILFIDAILQWFSKQMLLRKNRYKLG